MKKIVTLLAACAAIVLASCAQPSTSGSGVVGGGSEAGETKVAYGLTALDGWGFYTISEATATSARVSYNGNAPTQYSTCCGADITTGTATKATFKVKNNGKESAYVKVDVKHDTNGSAVTVATINGSDADVQYGGADTTIEADGEAEFVFTLDSTKKANKLVVALNNDQSSNPTSGDITISDAYMYK